MKSVHKSICISNILFNLKDEDKSSFKVINKVNSLVWDSVWNNSTGEIWIAVDVAKSLSLAVRALNINTK